MVTVFHCHFIDLVDRTGIPWVVSSNTWGMHPRDAGLMVDHVKETSPVCIYISAYIYIYLSIYLTSYLSIYLSVCLSIYLSIYLSLYICIYISNTQLRTLARVYIYMYIYICIYLYTCIYIYIYIYVYVSAPNGKYYNSFRSFWIFECTLRIWVIQRT